MDEVGKTRAIIAHITIIGWIIALVQNSSDKNEFAGFYIRQMLGLIIISFGLSIVGNILLIIPIIGWLIWLGTTFGVIALWIHSLVGAVNGKKEPTPFIGQHFQAWFRTM